MCNNIHSRAGVGVGVGAGVGVGVCVYVLLRVARPQLLWLRFCYALPMLQVSMMLFCVCVRTHIGVCACVVRPCCVSVGLGVLTLRLRVL